LKSDITENHDISKYCHIYSKFRRPYTWRWSRHGRRACTNCHTNTL